MNYPDLHHPCYFIEDSLRELGADALVVRDERTLGCWGLIVNGKTVVYLIDVRWLHERQHEDPAAAELLNRGDLVCCAQEPDALRIGAKWLPLAVTPGYRLPSTPQQKLYDVSFVGFVRDPQRERVLRHVARYFNLHVAQGVFGDAAVSAYWQSWLGLNVPTRYGDPLAYDSLNMRAWEILATGTPLVTPQNDSIPKVGLGGKAFLYGSIDDLLKTIEVALLGNRYSHEWGNDVACYVSDHHTYTDRAKQILEWLT